MKQKSPILLVMAAGMGSRYGGLKQIDPVGPSGEVLLHYSVFDAYRAGFRRVIFLIKHQIENDFKAVIEGRLPRDMAVTYAFQELDKLPQGYHADENRVKPFGTGHAVLCCKDVVDAPFAVINSDDYYGADAFRVLYDYLSQMPSDSHDWCMVGYALKNTTSENGSVSRGVCTVGEDGCLQSIRENLHIIESCDGPLTRVDDTTYQLLSGDTVVSMNMFGFSPALMAALQEGFVAFLDTQAKANPLKAEYLIPTEVQRLMDLGSARVKVLHSSDKWLGVTYQEDKPVVRAALSDMAQRGIYPTPLWAN